MCPGKRWIRERRKISDIARKHGFVKRAGGYCYFALAFGFSARHTRRLPVHHLPLAIAFDECAAVEQIGDILRTASLGSCNETKRDDRGVAVLLNADIFSSVNRLRIRWFRGGRRAHVVHHLGLVHATAGRTCVDQIVGPETLVYGGIIARSAGEKVVEELSELGGVGRGLRAD